MFNPAKVLQLKSAWDRFNANHPRFQPFLKAVGRDGVREGCIYEITVTTPEGQTTTTNIKLQQDDIELLNSLKSLM